MVEYTKLSVKKELMDKVQKFIHDYPEHGYRSLAQFVEDAVRRRAEELRLFEITPRFGHFNIYEDRVVILDRKIGPRDLVTLRVKPVGERGFKLYCERCGSTNCEHVLYATRVPEIMDPFEERGGEYRGEYGEE